MSETAYQERRLRAAIVLTASTLALGAPLPADAAEPSDAIERATIELRDRALGDGRSYQLLRSLTSEVGPRFAGTAGDRAGVAWALEAMRRQGLDNVRAEPVTVPRWVRGHAHGRILEPHPRETFLIALGGSVGTPAEGVTAEVLEVESPKALEQLADEDVAGKIVFFNYKMARFRDGRDYGVAAQPRRSGAARAAEKGAVAMLMRSAGTGAHRFPHTGGMRYEEGVAKIPGAALAVPDAEILETLLAGDAPVRFHLDLGARYVADAQSANVIGEITGREAAEEIVLLGGHLDSWDVGSGAIDDGAGCVTALAAAALIGELAEPPRRTIRVVLFANEEFGLSGARAYAEAHADELSRHVLAAESDLGAGKVWRFASRVDTAALPAMEQLADLLEPLGIESFGNTARGGADLRPMREAGVPLADLTQDATYYFDYHHTEDDTFNKVDPEALAQNLAAYAALAYWAAESPIDFGRAPAPATP